MCTGCAGILAYFIDNVNVLGNFELQIELHFERILPLQLSFCAIGKKNAGNAQQNALHERLFIRKSALSVFFCCGFGAGKYYLK